MGEGEGEKSDSQYRPHDLLSGSGFSKTFGPYVSLFTPFVFSYVAW